MHLALFLALSLSPGNSLVSSWFASFLALTVSNSSLFTPALLRTHSFVFFSVHEIRISYHVVFLLLNNTISSVLVCSSAASWWLSVCDSLSLLADDDSYVTPARTWACPSRHITHQHYSNKTMVHCGLRPRHLLYDGPLYSLSARHPVI